MSLLDKIFKIPEKLLMLIAAFIALFIVSILSGWFPGFGNMFWGFGLLGVGILLPETVIAKSRNYNLTVNGLAVLIGIAIIVANVVLTNIPGFSVTVLQSVYPSGAMSIASQAESVGIDIETVDTFTSIFASLATGAIAILSGGYILKTRKGVKK